MQSPYFGGCHVIGLVFIIFGITHSLGSSKVSCRVIDYDTTLENSSLLDTSFLRYKIMCFYPHLLIVNVSFVDPYNEQLPVTRWAFHSCAYDIDKFIEDAIHHVIDDAVNDIDQTCWIYGDNGHIELNNNTAPYWARIFYLSGALFMFLGYLWTLDYYFLV